MAQLFVTVAHIHAKKTKDAKLNMEAETWDNVSPKFLEECVWELHLNVKIAIKLLIVQEETHL